MLPSIVCPQGILCPRGALSALAGTLQPGMERPRMFRPGTFRQGTVFTGGISTPPPNFVGNLPRGHGKLYKENTTGIHIALQ
jgi:hypothetical protein